MLYIFLQEKGVYICMFIIIIKYIYLHTDALHTCSGFEQHLASARAPLLHSSQQINPAAHHHNIFVSPDINSSLPPPFKANGREKRNTRRVSWQTSGDYTPKRTYLILLPLFFTTHACSGHFLVATCCSMFRCVPVWCA